MDKCTQTQLPFRSGFFQTCQLHCYNTGMLRRKKKSVWKCLDTSETRVRGNWHRVLGPGAKPPHFRVPTLDTVTTIRSHSTATVGVGGRSALSQGLPSTPEMKAS